MGLQAEAIPLHVYNSCGLPHDGRLWCIYAAAVLVLRTRSLLGWLYQNLQTPGTQNSICKGQELKCSRSWGVGVSLAWSPHSNFGPQPPFAEHQWRVGRKIERSGSAATHPHATFHLPHPVAICRICLATFKPPPQSPCPSTFHIRTSHPQLHNANNSSHGKRRNRNKLFERHHRNCAAPKKDSSGRFTQNCSLATVNSHLMQQISNRWQQVCDPRLSLTGKTRVSPLSATVSTEAVALPTTRQKARA